MYRVKVSLILLSLLAMLLMTSSPASAKVTRIYFNMPIRPDSETNCYPALQPPHLSGPNMHLQGTWTCPTEAFTLDGQPFAMFTGIITWTDCQAQVVDGHMVYQAKIRVDTYEGGAWVGNFAWPATGVMKAAYHGEGIYEGMMVFGYFDPINNAQGGYVQMNQ